jgi:1-acyl-sn-glycerol-3-phosphate acyltransferase
MIYEISKNLAFFLLKLFFKIEYKGQESFPEHTCPFILASNHQSNIDPFAVGVGCRYQLTYLAKEELFKNRLFGFYLKHLNVIPLQREKSDLRTMRLALNLLKTKPLLIFPQGTRSQDLDTFKSGVGFLSKKAAVPIVVAKIEGTDQILPKGATFFKSGKIKVTYARVDTITEADAYEDIALKVVNKIKSL